MSCPSSVIGPVRRRPRALSRIRLRPLGAVVLPQPEGPKKARVLPRQRSKLASVSACVSPYQRARPRTLISAREFRATGWTKVSGAVSSNIGASIIAGRADAACGARGQGCAGSSRRALSSELHRPPRSRVSGRETFAGVDVACRPDRNGPPSRPAAAGGSAGTSTPRRCRATRRGMRPPFRRPSALPTEPACAGAAPGPRLGAAVRRACGRPGAEGSPVPPRSAPRPPGPARAGRGGPVQAPTGSPRRERGRYRP